MEPKIPINTSCFPVPLKIPVANDCSNPNYGTAFNGKINENSYSRKIGILLTFGFDVDVLEIYLNELWDIIDQFFIIESTKAHFHVLSKSLLWEQVKNQPRFIKFGSKITHFIVDDAENAGITAKHRIMEHDIHRRWEMERAQERLRWTKFLEWNKEFNMFGEDDLIGFSDADEIPARKMVHMMKYCELKKDMLKFGLWFAFGNINEAFASDYPVPWHQYTIGVPTFYSLKTALKESNRTKLPKRLHGLTGRFLLGGIHMSYYVYLPFQLVREISCTECQPYPIKSIIQIGNRIKNNEILQLELEREAVPEHFSHRVVNLTSIAKEMENIAILPWFYDCNRKRYPAWERNHDTRLD